MSHHKKEMGLCEGTKVLAETTVVIILQYIKCIKLPGGTLTLQNGVSPLYLSKDGEKVGRKVTAALNTHTSPFILCP